MRELAGVGAVTAGGFWSALMRVRVAIPLSPHYLIRSCGLASLGESPVRIPFSKKQSIEPPLSRACRVAFLSDMLLSDYYTWLISSGAKTIPAVVDGFNH